MNSKPPIALHARDQPLAEISHQKVSGLTGAIQVADRSLPPNAATSSCHWAVSRVIVAADNPAPDPGTAPGLRPEIPAGRPCRYSNGNTSAICGDLRAYAGTIVDENRCRSTVSGSIRLSLTRGACTLTAPPRSARRGASVAHPVASQYCNARHPVLSVSETRSSGKR